MIGTGLRRISSQAVVVAHHSLYHRDIPIRRLFPHPAADLPGGGKIGVQISAGHSQYRAVKHGVDVVRPALVGPAGKSPPLKGRKQSAGEQGFPRPAPRRSYEDSSVHGHSSPPNEMIYTGFWPIIRWWLPAVRLLAVCTDTISPERSLFFI